MERELSYSKFSGVQGTQIIFKKTHGAYDQSVIRGGSRQDTHTCDTPFERREPQEGAQKVSTRQVAPPRRYSQSNRLGGGSISKSAISVLAKIDFIQMLCIVPNLELGS